MIIHIWYGNWAALLFVVDRSSIFDLFDASEDVYAAIDRIYVGGKLRLVELKHLQGVQDLLHEGNVLGVRTRSHLYERVRFEGGSFFSQACVMGAEGDVLVSMMVEEWVVRSSNYLLPTY